MYELQKHTWFYSDPPPPKSLQPASNGYDWAVRDLHSSAFIASVILIVLLLLLESQTVTSLALNYAHSTPTDRWLGVKACYTLEHYANQQNTYFTDGSSFYFFPDLHGLEEDIRIMIDVHNLSFQGVIGSELKNCFQLSSQYPFEE